MSSSQPSTTIRVRVPATSGNLGPGFDTLGLALALHNIFEGAPAQRLSFEAAGSEAAGLAREDPARNLLWRAIREAYRHRGVEAPPFALRCECRIPLARGLGSSASAIVGGLMIASRFLVPQLSKQELLDLSTRMEGHPDNAAAAIAGGLTAAAVCDGGLVRLARLRLPADVGVLALVPDYELATVEARRVLPQNYSRGDVVFNLSRVAVLTASLAAGDTGSLWDTLADRVHQPYRAPLVKGFDAVLSEARRLGALGAFLSGAGPTILVLAAAADRPRLASALRGVLRKSGVTASAMELGVEGHGARYTRATRD